MRRESKWFLRKPAKNKMFLLISLLLAVIVISLNQISADEKSKIKNNGKVDRQVVLKVENMTCGMCTINVRKAIYQLDGIGSVDVTRKPPQAIVQYYSKKTNKEEIAKVITNVGYPATVVSDVKIKEQ